MNDLATLRSICAETVPALLAGLKDADAYTHQVYFLYCSGFIKIGMTKSLKTRMSSLQLGKPFRTQIVLLIRGGRRTEEYFHYIFRDYHVGGEWFELGPRIRETIENTAPSYCVDWLKEEEEAHKNWIEAEAQRLGLIPLPPSHGEAA